MRLAFAAATALLLAAPALAGSASSFRVGFVVTGKLAAPLSGAWQSRTAPRGAIYHFVVDGGSGALFKLVSVPLRGATGRCDLRLRGVIYSLERTSSRALSYEMRYGIEEALVVTSSTDPDRCEDVAAAYVTGAPEALGTHSLVLSAAGEERLIDNATGAEYIRH